MLFILVFLSPLFHCGYRTGLGLPGYSWRAAEACGLMLGGVVIVLGYLTVAEASTATRLGAVIGYAIGWAMFWALAHWTGYGLGRLVRWRRQAQGS